METPDVNPLDKLNDRQKKFVVEYLSCLNGAKAARIAGYSEKTADRIAYENLRKPEIQAAVSYLGEQMGMSAGEAFKHYTDIARSRLNDFLIVEKVLRSPTIRKPLREVIDDLLAVIDFEQELSVRAEYDEEELGKLAIEQAGRKRKIIRYELELERNPKAYRDMDGEAEWVEDIRIDLVGLAKAKAEGRIKSLSFTEFGPKVELYSAETALDKVMQLHGRYKQVPGDANQQKEVQVYQLPDGTKIVF